MTRQAGSFAPLPALALGALALALAAPSTAQGPVDLFKPPPESAADLNQQQEERLAALEADPTARSVQIVAVDPAATESLDGLNFNLAPGSQTLTRSRVETRGARDYSWFGEQPDGTGSAVLVVRDGEMTGNFQIDGQLYRLRPLGGGLHALVEVDAAAFPEDHPPEYEYLEEEPPATAVESLAGAESALADACNRLDLIIAYTPAAVAQAGDIGSLVQLAVDETNHSYDRSGVDLAVNVVHAYETAYTESGDMVVDRNRFRDDSDGFMDEIHGLRDTHGADVAILITARGNYCGIAAAILAAAPSAFAVVGQNCATGYYSFGHEIGHLQGARHNPQADPTNIPFAYGHGLFHRPGSWRTVMSYNCSPGNCTRLQNWSNPEVRINGVPSGTAAGNDNRRVLNDTACTLANFRPAVGPPPVTVSLAPNPLELASGADGDLVATVARGGTALSGVTVTFQSADSAIATVAASAVTDDAGRATATVQAVADGETTVAAEAQGASAEAVVQVPFGAAWALMAAAAAMLLVLAWRARRSA